MTKEIMGRLYRKSEEVIAANPNNLQVLAQERMFIALGTTAFTLFLRYVLSLSNL
jgi:hypothetical protein